MDININKSLILFLFPSILLFGCSQQNNNIDFSNLPVIKPKKAVNKEEGNADNLTTNNDKFIKDLDTFKSRENLLSNFKFGKNDPFSPGYKQFNQFSSNFELTGFLNTEGENYVFVRYLGNEGIISEDSIGGLNTEFLPDGAKVINIDTKKSQLEINFDNENFIFKL